MCTKAARRLADPYRVMPDQVKDGSTRNHEAIVVESLPVAEVQLQKTDSPCHRVCKLVSMGADARPSGGGLESSRYQAQ